MLHFEEEFYNKARKWEKLELTAEQKLLDTKRRLSELQSQQERFLDRKLGLPMQAGMCQQQNLNHKDKSDGEKFEMRNQAQSIIFTSEKFFMEKRQSSISVSGSRKQSISMSKTYQGSNWPKLQMDIINRPRPDTQEHTNSTARNITFSPENTTHDMSAFTDATRKLEIKAVAQPPQSTDRSNKKNPFKKDTIEPKVHKGCVLKTHSPRKEK